MRKFERISREVFLRDIPLGDYDELVLPKRSTKYSAGYDFYSPISFTLNPGERKVIPTGIKVCMNDNEFLAIYVRSSLGFKWDIRMCNQVGIIDADYYVNSENEGHIFVCLKNEGNSAVTINKGDRFVQGIFTPYLITVVLVVQIKEKIIMNNDKKFYISTAIAYTSSKPHIGNTYEIVLADAIARYKRLEGYDVYFQTGTDEHGQKIEDKAREAGVSPQEYVDKIAGEIKSIWDLMDTSYDRFVRTTDKEHEEKVQRIFKKLYDQGDIYKSEYKGLYCTPCESL